MTDSYYQQNNNKKKRGHKKKWTSPDTITMKCYFGIRRFMGIVKKPTLQEYWTKNHLFETPLFRDLLSYDHFRQIKSSLHFIDENFRNENDFLYKIRPLVDHLIAVSQSVYFPEKGLSLDESMIRFNGRSRLKVHMPLKPIKYGFKAYVLAESKSGYLLNWNLHNGQYSSLIDIISSLTKNYNHQGHRISMDRFYTSIDTVEYLNDNGFEVLGAVMKNRARLSKEIEELTKKFSSGDNSFFCSLNKKLLLTVWKDIKIVFLFSNIGDNKLGKTRRSYKPTGSNIIYQRKIVDCPNTILNYSDSARGVDYLDQMMSYYSPIMRSRKWYIAILLHFLEIALHNSFIIYKKMKDQKLQFLDFRKAIMESLILEFRQRKLQPSQEQERIKGRSETMLIELQNKDCELAYNVKSKCRVCKETKDLSKFTSYWCKTHEFEVCVLKCYDFHRLNLHKND